MSPSPSRCTAGLDQQCTLRQTPIRFRRLCYVPAPWLSLAGLHALSPASWPAFRIINHLIFFLRIIMLELPAPSGPHRGLAFGWAASARFRHDDRNHHQREKNTDDPTPPIASHAMFL